MKLKVMRKSHVRPKDGRAVTYSPGESFDGTEAELAAFSDRLEKVEAKRAPKKTAKKVRNEPADDDGSSGDSPDGA